MPEIVLGAVVVAVVIIVFVACLIWWLLKYIIECLIEAARWFYRLVTGAKDRELEHGDDPELLELLMLEREEEQLRLQKEREQREKAAQVEQRAKAQRAKSASAAPEGLSLKEVEDCCNVLGIDVYYTLAELSAARRTKTAQWHPDKLEHMAPELKEYASQHVVRFNAAFERLEGRVKWNGAPGTIEAEAQDVTAMVTEITALMAAILAGLENLLTSGDDNVDVETLPRASVFEKAIERHDDIIRRLRALLTRIREEAPTTDVTTLENNISTSINGSQLMRRSLAKCQELGILSRV